MKPSYKLSHPPSTLNKIPARQLHASKLQRRSGLEKPIQMWDALSRNLCKEFEVLLSNCLPHGRRNYVDVAESFPAQFQEVLEKLELVFKNDAEAIKRDLKPEERLRHFQAPSGPVMKRLQEWMKEQIDQKQTEPNSGLGEVVQYMPKHGRFKSRRLLARNNRHG